MHKKSKRLIKEMQENKKPGHLFYLQPLPGDMYTWHFTFIGQKDTPYHNGLYHGKICLPSDYPLSPPDIYYLNENGRYKINSKICLTITSHHKESWTPAWTLRTMMEAICAYFLVDDSGIGSIRNNADTRKKLAAKTRDFKCSHCGYLTEIEKTIKKNW